MPNESPVLQVAHFSPAGARPSISVIIPCYNQAHYLAQAIDSALGQTYPADEVIVVDDGSTDATEDVARAYGARVRYLRQPNMGLSAARNTGVRGATGDLLYFLDSDDMAAPDMLERMAAAATRQPDVDCYHGGWWYVDQHGAPRQRFEAAALPGDPLLLLLRGNRFPPCALLVRRAAVERAGLFDEGLRACEDWDLWLRLAAAGSRFAAVPGAVGLYRRYEGSMSTDYQRMWRAGLQVIRRVERSAGGSSVGRRELRRAVWHWRRKCFKRVLQGMHRGPVSERLRLATHALREDPLLVALFVGHGGLAALRRTGMAAS